MFKLISRLVLRKVRFLRIFGRRKLIIITQLLLVYLTWLTCWWLVELTSEALMPPKPPNQNLELFRRNRNLSYYIDDIQVLIEPSSTPCATLDEVPIIVLVTSAPQRLDHREAIRQTWARYQPTYFVLGLSGAGLEDEQLVDTYIEAKQYGDMVVFDFQDHYQNLTLKTALMIRWTLHRCSQTQFLFKTDDDVLVNPWMLKQVLKDNVDAKLLGYRITNALLHRDEYTKWYLPRWLCPEDVISSYLSGTGYLINGEYLRIILKAANKVPLVNMEDIYFTYLVSFKMLGLTLTHDRRLSPYKPWLSTRCAYWSYASVHSLAPNEMISGFGKMLSLANGNYTRKCDFFNAYLSGDWLLY